MAIGKQKWPHGDPIIVDKKKNWADEGPIKEKGNIAILKRVYKGERSYKKEFLFHPAFTNYHIHARAHLDMILRIDFSLDLIFFYFAIYAIQVCLILHALP